MALSEETDSARNPDHSPGLSNGLNNPYVEAAVPLLVPVDLRPPFLPEELGSSLHPAPRPADAAGRPGKHLCVCVCVCV